MNGIHDMGGMDGFGRVEPETDEPVFHAPWEGRVLAMHRALGATGAWTIDASRYAREMLPPDVYLASSYYWQWLLGMEANLVAFGLVDADEIGGGRSLRPAKPLPRGRLAADDVGRVLRRGSYARSPTAPARFAVGERVRAKNMHPKTHTRLPRYARGHVGVIDRLVGCHVFPDAAAGGSENPQWLYTVAFAGRELWGSDADPSLTVSIEAFEPYLEPA
jgi:nitrile hydratase subunit beta